MKTRVLTAVLLALGLMGAAHAAPPSCNCSTGTALVDGPGNGNGNKDLTNALSGKTVCVANGAGGWEWQEQHRSGGELWDYKLGSNPVDPSEKVGSWVVNGGTVTHSYTGGSSFSYTVRSQSPNFCFCPSSGSGIQATIKAGVSAGCP